MPTPLSIEKLKERYRVWMESGCDVQTTADMLGISERSVYASIQRVKQMQADNPCRNLYEELGKSYLAGEESYGWHYGGKKISGKTRLLLIGDTHDEPEIDKLRFFCFGRMAVCLQVNQIVQIGDWASVDSLCYHVKNDTKDGKKKAAAAEDLKSLEMSLREFKKGLAGYKCDKHITLGNHEHRFFDFENKNPELGGVFSGPLVKMFKAYDWSVSDFGSFFMYGDMGFTHAPRIGFKGRPAGGLNAGRNINKFYQHHVAWGHTHTANVETYPKINGNEKSLLHVINTGSAENPGRIHNYSRHQPTGQTYGVFLLDFKDGAFKGYSFINMETIIEMYGPKKKQSPRLEFQP